jgi:hypothetical protein
VEPAAVSESIGKLSGHSGVQIAFHAMHEQRVVLEALNKLVELGHDGALGVEGRFQESREELDDALSRALFLVRGLRLYGCSNTWKGNSLNTFSDRATVKAVDHGSRKYLSILFPMDLGLRVGCMMFAVSLTQFLNFCLAAIPQ